MLFHAERTDEASARVTNLTRAVIDAALDVGPRRTRAPVGAESHRPDTARVAHAPGWIELYRILEAGRQPPAPLVAQCLGNRNGVGETMLHWYAIEGSADVLQQLVDLGFPIDAVHPEDVPILSAARVGNWDNVRVLRRAGARIHGVTPCGYTYRGAISRAGDSAPADLRGDAYTLDDLLDPAGPEDQPVLTLTLSHPRITPKAFEAWVAERPDLDLGYEVDLVAMWFETEPEPGQLSVSLPSMAMRHLLHHIATTTGAHIEWEF